MPALFLCRIPPSLGWLLIGFNEDFLEVTNRERVSSSYSLLKRTQQLKVRKREHMDITSCLTNHCLQALQWRSLNVKACAFVIGPSKKSSIMPINSHPKLGGILHRKSAGIVPEPFFPVRSSKKKGGLVTWDYHSKVFVRDWPGSFSSDSTQNKLYPEMLQFEYSSCNMSTFI